jgi:hypothetical protein
MRLVRWGLALCVCACTDPAEPTPKSFLVVQVAAQQPEFPALGVTVVINASVGTLRMRTVGGRHRLTPDSVPHETSCVRVPDGLMYFTVEPAEGEALLLVDLLPSADVTGPADADLATSCPGYPLEFRVVPIRRPTLTVAADASTEAAAVSDAAVDGDAGVVDGGDQ